jgi:hypothetical protein
LNFTLTLICIIIFNVKYKLIQIIYRLNRQITKLFKGHSIEPNKMSCKDKNKVTFKQNPMPFEMHPNYTMNCDICKKKNGNTAIIQLIHLIV